MAILMFALKTIIFYAIEMNCILNLNIRFSYIYREQQCLTIQQQHKKKEMLRLKTERQKTWHTSCTDNIRAHLK